MLAGGDCIDDADLLRCGQTASVLGHRVMAPSTLGTFLRSFTFGHIRQLDRLTEQLLLRAWTAGAGPGDGPMTMDLDSTRGAARFVDELARPRPPGWHIGRADHADGLGLLVGQDHPGLSAASLAF
jgi:hypothetical protein